LMVSPILLEAFTADPGQPGGLWSVSHQSSVICMLQLKDPPSVQLGGGLQPPDVEEVAIEPIDDCHPAVVLNFLMEKLGDA